MNWCLSWCPQGSHSKINVPQSLWPALSLQPASPSGITWIYNCLRTLTACTNSSLGSETHSTAQCRGRFSCAAVPLSFPRLGIWKYRRTGNWTGGAENVASTARERVSRQGSEGGNGTGAELCTGSVWKLLRYCGSQTAVRSAAGSEIPGLCSSGQLWNLCSPVSASGRHTACTRFCLQAPSSLLTAAAPRATGSLPPLQWSPPLFLGFQSSPTSCGVCTDTHPTPPPPSNSNLSLAWKKHQKAGYPFTRLSATIWGFPFFFFFTQLITKKDV